MDIVEKTEDFTVANSYTASRFQTSKSHLPSVSKARTPSFPRSVAQATTSAPAFLILSALLLDVTPPTPMILSSPKPLSIHVLELINCLKVKTFPNAMACILSPAKPPSGVGTANFGFSKVVHSWEGAVVLVCEEKRREFPSVFVHVRKDMGQRFSPPISVTNEESKSRKLMNWPW